MVIKREGQDVEDLIKVFKARNHYKLQEYRAHLYYMPKRDRVAAKKAANRRPGK